MENNLELDIYINGFTNKIDVIQNIIDKCQDGNGYDAIDDLQALKEIEEKETKTNKPKKDSMPRYIVKKGKDHIHYD